MTTLDLSDRPAPQESGIGGRFLVDWKTIAGLIVTAILAWASLNQRMSLIEATNENLKVQQRMQNDDLQQQLREIRGDVKELLRRRQP
jgi:hypothetical protein